MNFKKTTSYNTKDTVLADSGNGRITIQHGVKRRCELILRSLGKIGSSTPTELKEHMQSRYSESYSVTDISYVLKRLVTNNVVSNKDGHYKLTPKSLDKWSKIPKEFI